MSRSPKAQASKAAKSGDRRSFPRRLGVQENADFEQRKLIVLRAAAKLFCEKGFGKTSMDDICAALDVTKPTVYHYGRSKDDMVAECLEYGAEQLRQALPDLEAQAANGLGKLKALFGGEVEGVARDPMARLVVTIDPRELSAEVLERYKTARRDYMQLVERFVREAADDGSVRTEQAQLLSFALTGAFNFVGSWYRPGRGLSPAEVTDGMWKIFLDGVRGESAD